MSHVKQGVGIGDSALLWFGDAERDITISVIHHGRTPSFSFQEVVRYSGNAKAQGGGSSVRRSIPEEYNHLAEYFVPPLAKEIAD